MRFTIKNILPIKTPAYGFLFFVTLLLISTSSFAQEKKRIEILQAGSLVESENIANAQRLIDSVIIRHQEVLMYCDSAYTYEGSNRVDFFGNVHINQGDTVHLYASKVFYDGDKNFARAIHNVRLENKETTLYTDTLDYDMNLNIGYYDCFGKIIDSTNTLTSQIGKYYMNEDVVHFIDSVKGYSEDYTLTSDNIKYNTVTEIIYIEGPTYIQDSTDTIYSEKGWYNTINGEAKLTLHPKVYNATQFLSANNIIYEKNNGNGFATGSAFLEDYENHTIVQGNKVSFNQTTEIATVTDSALFIAYNNLDTLFLHADTLKTIPDTVPGENLVKAYYGVRFFRNDIQGVCDSLIYFTKDSLVQLHYNPVLWSEMHQLSANNIELRQHANAPDEMHLTQNSFIISKQDSGRFDQIKGKNMLGYVVNGKLNNVDVDGNGQTLYYARDKEAIIGINNAESSTIGIHFKEGKIHTIKFDKQPVGQLKPLENLSDGDKTLPGFDWKIRLRPLSKDDVFRKVENTELTTSNQAKKKSEKKSLPPKPEREIE
jgi:lipopolysaccharide export system protein LptA